VNAAARRVTFAVAGSAVGALMLIGFKGTQGPAGTQAGGTTGDSPVGGIPVNLGRATLPSGTYTADGSVISTPFGPVQVSARRRHPDLGRDDPAGPQRSRPVH
jgi:hypothetical protein